ncbi:MAG: Asp-tRNA(Asn)/Glu-tRNA(Gln) amidotransferase subunit GatC [Vampirovibrionales bacterium]
MMATITEKDVTHVAKLASLALSSEESRQYQDDLEKILGMIAQLNELPSETVATLEEHYHAGVVMVDGSGYQLREDVVQEGVSREALMQNAPDTEEGFFRIPKILAT